MYKVSKFRIYPDGETRIYFAKNFGCVRWVYNDALKYCIEHYEKNRDLPKEQQEKRPGAYVLSLRLTEKKKEFEWLHEADSQALKFSLNNLDIAFKNFFRRVKNGQKPGFPKMKSRYKSKKSFTCTGICHVDFVSKRLKIPKCKPVRLRGGVEHDGKIQRVTISQVPSGKYFASVLFKNDRPDPVVLPVETPEELTSVDVGIGKLAHVDEAHGGKIYRVDIMKHILTLHKRLNRAQKRLSRCEKGSGHYKKLQLRVARSYEKITNYRHHVQHVLSKNLVKRSGGIVVEDVNIINLIKKIEPLQDESGKFIPNGRNKQRAINRRIMLSGWRGLIEKILYKSQEAGKPCILVDPSVGPNKICHNCHYYEKSVHFGMNHWTCPQCKMKHNRHENCLKNLRRIGFDMQMLSVKKRVDHNPLS